MLDERFQEFKNQLQLAYDLLSAARLKEIRDYVRSFRPLAILGDEIRPIRRIVKEYSDQIYGVGLPLIIVYAASCLELFLRDIWEEYIGPIDKKYRSIFSNPKEFNKKIGQKIKDDVVVQANMVAQIRHTIIHRGGIVDKDALCAFRKAGVEEIIEGMKLEFTADKVEKYLNILLQYANEVYNIFKTMSTR
ncbi:MAG: hypothetical protein QXW60_00010 [Nitrososphaerota archaeon]